MTTVFADPCIVSLSGDGYPLSFDFVSDPGIVKLSVDGDSVESALIVASPGIVRLVPEASTYTYSNRRNFVAWSKPGDVQTFTELEHGFDRRNSSGMAPMEWRGPGYAMRVIPLEELVVVYGTHGISVIRPYMDPIPTFGFEVISDVGIRNYLAVAGSEKVHYFVSSLYDLWRVTKSGPELLGFREYMTELTYPLLTYDEHEGRLWISNSVKGYCLDEGLGGGFPALTSASFGVFASPEALTSIPLNIATDTFDLGQRGNKCITFVEVGTDATHDLYAALDFRYSKSESWRTSAWTILNSEGVARLNVTGVEFRLRLKQLVYDDISIDYINMRFQKHDRRFLRGPLFTNDQTESEASQ